MLKFGSNEQQRRFANESCIDSAFFRPGYKSCNIDIANDKASLFDNMEVLNIYLLQRASFFPSIINLKKKKCYRFIMTENFSSWTCAT